MNKLPGIAVTALLFLGGSGFLALSALSADCRERQRENVAVRAARASELRRDV
jgi:hypothetical protein